jgi:hypothetical protein
MLLRGLARSWQSTCTLQHLPSHAIVYLYSYSCVHSCMYCVYNRGCVPLVVGVLRVASHALRVSMRVAARRVLVL